ncbi:hypothetical protein [Tautonia plasticadhaerens]|uniref:Core-2/I-Branching enzyme n=1 Tax=Tautonia plasticadhaerens TaxID=2527974 RepID=A0A518H342_9BACT|nr:hypothetical protein [Tautonia plasticadhaerens]QDV35255.1 hypothetical protein ElP_31580 [Tautonia plasticadhaerens]
MPDDPPPSRPTDRDLILAYATGSRFEDFYRFIASARRCCPPGQVDVVVHVDALGGRFSRAAIELGVTLVPVENVWKWTRGSTLLNRLVYANLELTRRLSRGGPAAHREAFSRMHRRLSADWIFPQAGRWLALHRFLEVNSAYRFVLGTDVRDVAFQANPFEGLALGVLHTFEQAGIRYGEDNLDTRWYTNIYRQPPPPGRLAGRPALCCGTVLGEYPAFMELMDRWSPEIARFPRAAIEQAMFNEVVSRDLDPSRVVRHDLTSGPVLTLCGDHEGSWTIRDDLVVASGRPVPVIHMYDRVPEVNDLIVRTIPVPDGD